MLTRRSIGILVYIGIVLVASLQADVVKPVVCIAFDEGKGDVSENQATGGDVQLHNATWTEGKIGRAVRFNGKDGFATFDKDSTISPKGTIEFWMKPEGDGGTVLAFSAGSKHYINNLLAVEYDAGEQCVRVVARWGAERYPYRWVGKSPAGSIPMNQWSLIDLVQDGVHPKLYINGRLALEVTTGDDLSSWTHSPSKIWFGWLIGGNRAENNYASFFQGAVDEIRIYNEPLTKAQIQAHFEGKYEPVGGIDFKTQGQRQVADLSGTWKFLPVWRKNLVYPPAEGKWKKIKVPTPWGARSAWQNLAGKPPTEWDETQGDGHYDGPGDSLPFAWYKRIVELPEVPAGSRIKLEFDAVSHRAWVYINGAPVCDHIGGSTPFEVDITDHVRPGKNEILVGVGDQRSFTRNRYWRREAAFAPTGAQYCFYVGIWQDVRLVIRPGVSIDDVFVMPSVQTRKLGVQTTLKNEGKTVFTGILKAAVLDGEKRVKEFKNLPVSLDPGQEKVVTFSEPFEKAQLWWPDDPKLYHTTVTLVKDDTVVDEQTRRFGFREFWIDGRSFRLNGAKVKLWNVWGHIGEYNRSGASQGPEGARRLWRAMKENHIHAVRLHGQPMNPCLLDTADEEGILIINESALYDGGHQFFDEPPYEGQSPEDLYRKNSYTHIREWVRRDRNHPSVVLWSSSNEFAFWCTPRNKKVTAFLLDLQNLIRTLDPTRPVKHSGYGALDGKEMTVDLHYPGRHSIPPNGFFWATGSDGGRWYYDGSIGSIYCNVQWRGDNPLCVGEDAPRMDPSILIGANAAEDEKERLKAFAEMWRMLINAYRLQDIAMESPAFFHSEGGKIPNSHLSAVRDVFKPLGVFPREYNRRFFAGQNAKRTLVVYNETYRPRELTLDWEVREDGKVIKKGTGKNTLPPGELAEIGIAFDAPVVVEEKNVVLTAKLREGDNEIETLNIPYRIYPAGEKIKLPSGTLCLFDPQKRTAEIFTKLGIPFEKIDSLRNVKDNAVLVIGTDAFTEELPLGEARRLKSFVKNGGTLVCLGQKNFPRWLPVRLEPAFQTQATVAFLGLADHPVLKGIQQDELQFWADDNFVADSPYLKPSSGNFNILIEAGGGSSLTPLVEIPYGKGAYVLCQMPLVSKMDSEPACRKLLRGILAYATGRKATTLITWDEKDSVSFTDYNVRGFRCIDLTKLHNRNFREEIATDKMMYSAWVIDRIKTIGDLPVGEVTFENIPFIITSPDKNDRKNSIVLRSIKSPYPFVPTPYIQDKAVIDVDGRFSSFYFLHTLSCNWTSNDKGSYVIHYADGTEEAVSLECGHNIESWPATPPRIMPHAKPVWRGITPAPEEATLYLFEWVNPHPEKKIDKIEFQLKPSTAIPILVAVTGKEITLKEEKP